MKATAHIVILTSLAMVDVAAIWQFYPDRESSHPLLSALIIILFLLGFMIIGKGLALQSMGNDENRDDDGRNTPEPTPPPLPDATNIPSCMRDYTPSSVHRDTVLTR